MKDLRKKLTEEMEIIFENLGFPKKYAKAVPSKISGVDFQCNGLLQYVKDLKNESNN